jgi:hypothetical protein
MRLYVLPPLFHVLANPKGCSLPSFRGASIPGTHKAQVRMEEVVVGRQGTGETVKTVRGFAPSSFAQVLDQEAVNLIHVRWDCLGGH